MGLGKEWYVVRETYRKIARVYERANVAATLGNVDRWKREVVSLFYRINGRSTLRVLDAGAGPSNLARHIKGVRCIVRWTRRPRCFT